MRARIPLMAVVAAAFLLAGCAGTTTAESDAGVAAPEIAVEGGAPEVSGEVTSSDAKGAMTAPTTVDRQVIRNGYVSMRVEDVTASVFTVRSLVAKRQGVISAEDTQSNGDMSYSTITAQIPAADLDAFIADVSALGTVDSINVSAQDVTSQVVDIDARIDALQTSIDRMTQLLAEASRIEDLLAIETQLSQRQAELDALEAQRDYLADQVAMSSITVTLSPQTSVAEVDAPGFLSGLQSGWAAFVSLIMVAITALGFLLPFLVIAAIVLVPVTVILVRQSRRHRQQAQPPADS